MTIEGNFKWDLDISDMELDELNALIKACERAREDIAKNDIEERLSQIMHEIKEMNCELLTVTTQGLQVKVDLDCCRVVNKKPSPLEV